MAEATYWYVVEGRGEFPRDMLRRDESRLADPADEAIVNAGFMDDVLLDDRDGRKRLRNYRIRLLTENRYAPNTKRWESFGLRVAEVGPGLYGEVSAPARGRPRKHREGTSPSERAMLSDRLLKESGGTRRTMRLSPAAVAALSRIRSRTGEASDAAVIERILSEEAERQNDPL